MPIYEYYCPACEKRFEELVFETKAAVVQCPQCGAQEVNRLISLFAAASGANDAMPTRGEGGHACGCGSCSCGHG